MGKRNRLVIVSFFLLGVVFITSLVSLVILNNKIRTETFWDNQQDKLLLITKSCINEIDAWTNNHVSFVQNMTDEIASGKFVSREEYEAFLKLEKRMNAETQTAYIVFENGMEYFSNDFAPEPEEAEGFSVWYNLCKDAGGEVVFTEPYLDPITNGIVISCLKFFTMSNGEQGIAGIDISIDSLIAKADNLNPSKTGGAYIVTPGLKVMTYYIDQSFSPKIIGRDVAPEDINLGETLDDEAKTPKYIVENGLSFLNAGWVLAQVEVLEVVDKYDETDGIHIEYIIDYDGAEKYEAIATLPTTGWIIGVNIPLDDYDDEVQKALSDQLPIIMLAVLASVISLVIAIVVIIGARRRQTLQRAIEIAQAASKTKSDFLSRMSHEMRTPMNAIIGMAKIAENTSDINKLRYCLSTIESSSTHLLGIINDILDMSKIEAGKLELYNEPLNIEKMLMKICNLIVDKTEQKGQTLDIVLGKNVGTHYIGDDLRLSQVVTNLMSNAIKFTPEGGIITLSVDEVRTNGNDSVLRFVVADTGIGMTKAQTERLFNSFEQADNSIARRFGGTGLGLAISRNIIEKMNGRIWVESEPDRGSKFTFEITLERAAKPDKAVIFDGICPSDLKVLVVDDDANTRRYFRSITEGFGINTEEAESGKRAIFMVENASEIHKPYDVIFIDYDMPDMDGIETARNLMAKIDKNTVIIMTSFLTWNKIEEQAAGVGVSRFIAKPLFPSSILDAINDVIGRTIKSLDIKSDHENDTSDLTGITLLLAEDLEINREIFISLVEGTNAVIETAKDGVEAVNKFKTDPEKYDVIIMDVQMPEMDGFEATKEIRKLEEDTGRRIPIIAMTANVFKEDIDLCLASGMDDHVAKPIDAKVVIEKIWQYSRQQ